MDDYVDTFLNVISLGKITSIQPYKAVLKGQFDVELEEEEYPGCISDTCMLLDGALLMTEFNNTSIKLLDKSYNVSKSFSLPSEPCGVCQTSKDEVVVTLPAERKVQYVNITDQWRLTRSFKVEDCCRGITHSNDQLLVSCGGHPGDEEYDPEGPGFVGIYDMSGTITCKIHVDPHGRQIFSVPRHITTTGNGRKIHIADWEGGVVTIDRNGNVPSNFSENLKGTTGVCAVSNNSFVVCGKESNNVLQIDTSGNIVAELLTRTNEIELPFSVSYVRNSSMIIVTFSETNEIKIFDLVL